MSSTEKYLKIQLEALTYLIATFPKHKERYRQQIEILLNIDRPLVITNNVATQTINC